MTEPVVEQLELLSQTADQRARDRVTGELSETLFVEAGAGSGKTHALVARLVRLVTGDEHDDPVPIQDIAAITFTERAAAELRDRIRRDLTAVATDTAASEAHRRACRDALDELDRAAIGTLHAFAQRILGEHALEAGLPPNFDVLDEIASAVEFDVRWDQFVDRMHADPEMERTLTLADALGVTSTALRDVAQTLGDNWDLLERIDCRDPGDAPTPPTDELAGALDEVVAMARRADSSDTLVRRIEDEVAPLATTLRATDDELEAVDLLVAEKPTFKYGGTGSGAKWKTAGITVEEARGRCRDLAGTRERITSEWADTIADRLARALARFTLESAEQRRREGRLEFHDLLVLSRRLLSTGVPGPARRRLHDRYRRVLLDEFQDTDPIQIHLAALITSDPDASTERPWSELPVKAGRLFVVGDPKQSIYRFRRADIATYLSARAALAVTPISLTSNFRSAPGIVAFVNDAFEQLIRPVPGAQPEYEALVAHRSDAPRGPAVVLVGADVVNHDGTADDLRRREADAVARTILSAVHEGWSVGTGSDTRSIRLGDIAILLPARTSLPMLQRALEDHQIPSRAETSSLVYSTREIRDVMAALRAIDDPSDELSLVTALRSPFFGCGDDDLWEFRVEHGGRFRVTAETPEALPADHPVVESIHSLRVLHEMKHDVAPSEIVERLLRERRAFESACAGSRTRDVWRRLRFVVDQARAFSDAEGGALRDYLTFAAHQADDGSRVVESVLPETDDDAVRILTVHGSKGLEFPMTIVSGMTTAQRRARAGGSVLFHPDGSDFEVKVASGVATRQFEHLVPLDEQMEHEERLRLLYVACTRACDHLVVSTFRDRTAPRASDAASTLAELMWRAAESGEEKSWQRAKEEPIRLPAPAARPVPTLPDREAWRRAREHAITEGSRPHAIAATTVARDAAPSLSLPDPESDDVDPGLAKHPRDLDLAAWRKGRYGTAVGRAVHAVLQTCDLATGHDVAATARAQSVAEGVEHLTTAVERLVRSGIESSVVAAARSGDHWRETYVATPVGERLLEGYVDLLYRAPDGLVVVDYKTDAFESDSDLDAKVDRYRLQGAAYALMVSRATSMPVHAVQFLFLHEHGAVARELVDLDASIRDVEQTIAVHADSVGQV